MALRARAASRKLQALSTEERVAMLNRVADALVANEAAIMEANALVRAVPAPVTHRICIGGIRRSIDGSSCMPGSPVPRRSGRGARPTRQSALPRRQPPRR